MDYINFAVFLILHWAWAERERAPRSHFRLLFCEFLHLAEDEAPPI